MRPKEEPGPIPEKVAEARRMCNRCVVDRHCVIIGALNLVGGASALSLSSCGLVTANIVEKVSLK